MLERIRNTDADFYTKVGPFLSRREIVRETGFPVWDDDGKLWTIAIEDGIVVGVSARITRKNTTKLCSAYVLPRYRLRGIYSAMIADRLSDIEGPCLAVATAMSRRALESHGFRVTRSGKIYCHMERST